MIGVILMAGWIVLNAASITGAVCRRDKISPFSRAFWL